ncbi:hypothetical protein HPB48_014896 [Haemaphysalis longicornis]|uniref:FMN hydroxy acid dehydrogenase domain-containing protein n=1 Tax=Haemaphysalis longicornis TaxID=44386 RepID=A0A9J6GAX7_HAELO|nr:hypothetical protein HPB48_014896 [Haemaphysalis longicornis]
MVVSMLSSTPLEQVAAAAGPDVVLWSQVDIRKDRSITLQDALRAKRCGCAAIVVTLDPPLVTRSKAGEEFASVSKPMAEMFQSVSGRTPGHKWDESRNWADVDMLRDATDLPVVLKGILRADDAVEAVNHGAAAIIVSNHGGRRMDGVTATVRN